LEEGGDSMKTIKIVLLKQLFEELKEALKWDGRERSAYLLCHCSMYGDIIKLMPFKVFRIILRA